LDAGEVAAIRLDPPRRVGGLAEHVADRGRSVLGDVPVVGLAIRVPPRGREARPG
jgi:hypothetical protein